ncbi:caspase-3-like [Paramacrobiotus metropolitanus]|uniref:caspase-3-like n=1 Tax=Paramacrobiotus metropolitanus TaxID=2943436 RepID=UPI002445EC55|nr:caspase-3-like [Paramacrobiotus metropolitanus]XP_055346877.1 caspase-3-like [Paramacrobiotus metropolitanus]
MDSPRRSSGTTSSVVQFLRSILGTTRKDRQPSAGQEAHLKPSFIKGITMHNDEKVDARDKNVPDRDLNRPAAVFNGSAGLHGNHGGSGRARNPPVPSIFDFRATRPETNARHAGGDQDMQDALPTPPVSKPPAPVPRTLAPSNIRDARYFMNHRNRGTAIIINNRSFDRGLGMPERKGTDLDAEVLTKAFALLGFDVISPYDNLSVHDMQKCMEYYATQDHTNSDCFAAAVLSHGDDGIVFGTDGKLSVERLVAPFKGNKSTSLAGKPKIFIFQACRGDRLDPGVDLVVADDKDSNLLRLPSEADFLFAYSTVPGYYSWRNTDNGSWYIQALGRLIQLYYGSDPIGPQKAGDEGIEFVRLLTKVNYEVAYYYKSSVPTNFDLDQQKQIPSIVSQLTRDLYFPTRRPVMPPVEDQVVAESQSEI